MTLAPSVEPLISTFAGFGILPYNRDMNREFTLRCVAFRFPLVVALLCGSILFVPDRGFCDKLKIVDDNGLTRAMKNIDDSGTVFVKIREVKPVVTALVLSNEDGIAADVIGTAENGKYSFSGVIPGTWRIVAKGGKAQIAEVKIQ